jgi:hypothetical protein
MDNQIEVSGMIDDLVKQLLDSKSIHRQILQEEYVRCLWEDGEIIVKHPCFVFNQKMELYKALAEKTGLSVRYLEYGVKFYQTLPLKSFDIVQEELHKRLPDKFVISERAVINILTEPKEKKERPSQPLQTNFKDAVPISLKEVIEYLKKAVYVRVYFDDETYETYKIEG